MDAHRHDGRRRASRGARLRPLDVPRRRDRPQRLILEDRRRMKLVTFDDGKVGWLDGEVVAELDTPSMRQYFETGEVARATGKELPLAEVALRAPIVPKKFFHTAGN